MSRLYDKRDLAFNIEYWNRIEMQLHASIANGEEKASFLDHVLDYPMGCNCLKGPCGKQHFKRIKVRESFDLERKRERMKLLRTGRLLSDLKFAQKNFDECDKCHYVASKGRTGRRAVECDVHSPALKKAKSNVYWAGERNLQERNVRGQIRTDGIATVQEKLEGLPEPTISVKDAHNLLNQWEEMYQRAKADGFWPAEATEYDVTPDYKGYLEVLRFEDEMTETEYLAELQRLRNEERELEESALQWAGANGTKQGTKKRVENRTVTFRRDSRYNIAVV